jgi:hypothetical protein
MKLFLLCKRFSFSLTLLALLLFTGELNAQSNALQLKTTAINPEEKGPSLINEIIAFGNNSNDSSGNNFASYSPTLSVTFSLSNQQYTLPAEQITSARGLSFGAKPNSSASHAAGSEIFPLINSISSPSITDFTFTPVGVSLNQIDINPNRAIEIFTSARALYNDKAATNGRYYYGDLTITFSQPVDNPILHVVGLGGFYSSLGFTTELELKNADIILSKLSGSEELVIAEGSKILNSATDPNSTTGAGAASGSLLATGSGIMSLTFRLYLKGDGDLEEWGTSTVHTGDVWLIGISLTAPVNISTNMISGINDYRKMSCLKQEQRELEEKRKINRDSLLSNYYIDLIASQ